MIKSISTVITRNIPLLTILILIGIFRLPSLIEPYWYGDEAITLTVGRALTAGWTLYQDIQDNKTPFLYYVAAASHTLFWLKFNLLWWHLLTVIGFWGLFGEVLKLDHSTASNTQKKHSQITATAIFSILTTLPLWEGNLANGEIFMIGPTIYGFWIIVKQLNNRHFTLSQSLAAGLAFSAAFMFKHPSAMDFIAANLLLLFLLPKFSRKALSQLIKNWIWISSGFAILVLLITINFILKGAFWDFVNSVFSQNFSYLGSWSSGQPVHQADTSSNGLQIRGILLIFSLAGLWFVRSRLPRAALLGTLWFLCALFGALLSGRPYAHYLLQIVPALSLLIGLAPVFYKSKTYQVSIVTALIILGVTHQTFNFWTYQVFPYYKNFSKYIFGYIDIAQYYQSFDPEIISVYQTADQIRTHTSRNEQIYMWGNQSAIYLLSDTLPVSKYIMAYHTKDFNGYQRVISDLENIKPGYIVTTTPPFPELQQFITDNYHLHQQYNSFTIYKNN